MARPPRAASIPSSSVTSSPMKTGTRPAKGARSINARTAVALEAPRGRTSQAMRASSRVKAAGSVATKPASRACASGPSAGAWR